MAAIRRSVAKEGLDTLKIDDLLQTFIDPYFVTGTIAGTIVGAIPKC
jgi:hypothetical protein